MYLYLVLFLFWLSFLFLERHPSSVLHFDLSDATLFQLKNISLILTFSGQYTQTVTERDVERFSDAEKKAYRQFKLDFAAKESVERAERARVAAEEEAAAAAREAQVCTRVFSFCLGQIFSWAGRLRVLNAVAHQRPCRICENKPGIRVSL
jgi:hypothetical protein